MRESKERKRVLFAAVGAAILAVVAAGCGNNTLNAAKRGNAGHEVSPIYGAAGGPRVIPAAGNSSTTSSSTTSTTTPSVPTSQQLTAALLGPEDSPANASAYRSSRLGGAPPCVQPVTAATGSTGGAAEVFYRGSTSPGGNTYPRSLPGAPSDPLQVAEYLQSYPASAVKAAYHKEVAALAGCKQASFTVDGARLAATAITPSTGPALGSPTTGFVATVTYDGTPLHAAMAVGVVGDVVAMVATATAGPPAPATLSTYVSRAVSDIRLHIQS